MAIPPQLSSQDAQKSASGLNALSTAPALTKEVGQSAEQPASINTVVTTTNSGPEQSVHPQYPGTNSSAHAAPADSGAAVTGEADVVSPTSILPENVARKAEENLGKGIIGRTTEM